MYGGLLGAESSGLGVYVEGSQWSSGPLVFIIGDRDQIYIKCLYVYVHYCEAGSQYGFWADWYISGRFPIWLGIGTNTSSALLCLCLGWTQLVFRVYLVSNMVGDRDQYISVLQFNN